MQKLTVREAAENLGISQDAVRKRIQRGTLAHRKASDGHVYVYMDNHAGAQQETTVEEISATNQDNRSSWWDYAAGASALIVAASGLIYVLGLFTLWAPIAMTNADYLTAWQAASLVPKTVVAGLGVSQLVAFPLLTGIVIFGVVFSVQKWREGIRKETLLILSLYVPVIIYCTWHIATGPSPLSQVPVPQLVGFVVVVTGIMYSLLSTIFWLSVDGVARGESGGQ